MPNIKFSYLYRDAGNYKNFGSVVFANPHDIDINELIIIIRAKLIDSAWFYADRWSLPDLHFDTWSNQTDHTFHEFEAVEYTNESISALISLPRFIEVINA